MVQASRLMGRCLPVDTGGNCGPDGTQLLKVVDAEQGSKEAAAELNGHAPKCCTSAAVGCYSSTVPRPSHLGQILSVPSVNSMVWKPRHLGQRLRQMKRLMAAPRRSRRRQSAAIEPRQPTACANPAHRQRWRVCGGGWWSLSASCTLARWANLHPVLNFD